MTTTDEIQRENARLSAGLARLEAEMRRENRALERRVEELEEAVRELNPGWRSNLASVSDSSLYDVAEGMQTGAQLDHPELTSELAGHLLAPRTKK